MAWRTHTSLYAPPWLEQHFPSTAFRDLAQETPASFQEYQLEFCGRP